MWHVLEKDSSHRHHCLCCGLRSATSQSHSSCRLRAPRAVRARHQTHVSARPIKEDMQPLLVPLKSQRQVQSRHGCHGRCERRLRAIAPDVAMELPPPRVSQMAPEGKRERWVTHCALPAGHTSNSRCTCELRPPSAATDIPTARHTAKTKY